MLIHDWPIKMDSDHTFLLICLYTVFQFFSFFFGNNWAKYPGEFPPPTNAGAVDLRQRTALHFIVSTNVPPTRTPSCHFSQAQNVDRKNYRHCDTATGLLNWCIRTCLEESSLKEHGAAYKVIHRSTKLLFKYKRANLGPLKFHQCKKISIISIFSRAT